MFGAYVTSGRKAFTGPVLFLRAQVPICDLTPSNIRVLDGGVVSGKKGPWPQTSPSPTVLP